MMHIKTCNSQGNTKEKYFTKCHAGWQVKYQGKKDCKYTFPKYKKKSKNNISIILRRLYKTLNKLYIPNLLWLQFFTKLINVNLFNTARLLSNPLCPQKWAVKCLMHLLYRSFSMDFNKQSDQRNLWPTRWRWKQRPYFSLSDSISF
jgi:hypothetical protein